MVETDDADLELRKKPVGILATGIGLCIFLLGAVAMMFLLPPTLVMLKAPAIDPPTLGFISFVLASLVSVLVIWFTSGGSIIDAFGLLPFKPGHLALVLVAYVFMYISSIYIVLVFRSFGLEFRLGVSSAESSSLTEVVQIAALTNAFFSPFYEELVFRGFLFRSYLRRYGFLTGVLVSSAIFGAIHVVPATVVYAFLLGVVSCLLVAKTGSVIPSIVLHLLFNSTSFVLDRAGIGVNSGLISLPVEIHLLLLTSALGFGAALWLSLSRMETVVGKGTRD